MRLKRTSKVKVSAAHGVRKARFGHGRVHYSIPGAVVGVELRGLDETVEAIIAQVYPGLVDEIEDGVMTVTESVVEDYPRYTGKTAAAFFVWTRIEKNRIISSVQNSWAESTWIWRSWSRFTREEIDTVIRRLRDPKDLGWLRFRSMKEIREKYPQHVDDKRIQLGVDLHDGRNYAAPVDRPQYTGKKTADVMRRLIRRQAKLSEATIQRIMDQRRAV